MGKVKDDAPAKQTSPAKAAPKASGARSGRGGALAAFAGNLARSDTFKPTQGRNARLWTAIGMGLLAAAGLYQMYEHPLAESKPVVRVGVPAALAALFAWFIWRIVQYPPFADFLIATEAEMNKVSWTSREDLKRATIVVLVTVLLMALYLFGVDYLWSNLLQLLRVLKFSGDGAFGSNAG